jgi:outer membrane usher protein
MLSLKNSYRLKSPCADSPYSEGLLPSANQRLFKPKPIKLVRYGEFNSMLQKDQIYRFILSKITPVKICPGRLPLYLKQPIRIKITALPLSFIFFSTSLIFLFSLPLAQAMETIIPVVYLNEEQKGEYFIKMTNDRDFLIKTEDLKAIGLLEPKGGSHQEEGVSYLSLKSLSNIKFIYDENRQTLKIQAPPELLSSTVLDFSNKPRKNVMYPKNNSVFLNYGINYNASSGFKFDSVGTTGQVGVRIGNFIFLSDSVLTVSEKETKFNRLMTSITYDRRDWMDTFVLGDSYASSGHLGSCILLGGLSYSKNFSADPNIVKRPVQDFQGYVTTPSEISVYLNGVRLRTERIPAGGYDLRNIMAYGGYQDMDIVIKDAFGREQHIANPFYVSDSLLAKGFHDYSYNLGFQRENIGADKDHYGEPVFLGFHRYGVTSHFTLGIRGEFGNGLYNLGPTLAYGTNLGVFELSLGGSRDKEDKTGFAGMANYSFQGKRFNFRIGGAYFSPEYSTISQVSSPNPKNLKKPKLEYGGGIGYGTKSFGSLALNYTLAANYENEEKELIGLLYSMGIGQKFSLTFSLNHTTEKGTDNKKNDFEFFVSLTYYPWKETIMTNTGINGDHFQGNFQIQKNAPIGEGYGYRASVDMRDEKEGFKTYFRPYFQYNGPYGIYSAEFSTQITGPENLQSYQFNASGAIVYVGNTFGFTRPVDDSFAIIQVGQVPNVRVYHNNQEIGKTDQTGKIVLPNFHSYDTNQVRINDRDIPLNYALTGVSRFISPSYRSGSLISFEAKKVQAFTGMLKLIKNGKKIPVEYHQISMKVKDKTLSFQTGRDGEFFIEDALAGSYKASFKYEGKVYTFDLTIPKSDEIIIDGGEIHVQVQP